MNVRRSTLSICVLGLWLVFCLWATPARAGEFRALFYHIHTIYSLDNPGWEIFKPSVAQVISRADWAARSMGLEASVAITDHRNIDAYFDPGFVPVGVAVPIKGEEWGGAGHAGALNFTGDSPITEYQGTDRYERMVQETHARGGIVIVNHPRSDAWETDRRLGVDGIEVWNTGFWDANNQKGLDWWHRLLVAGERITALAGSDSHFIFIPIEKPLNLVWCESNQPDDVVEGILNGRVIMLGAPASPRVFPGADLDGDGYYNDAMVGDVVEVAIPVSVDFQIQVEGASSTDTLILADKSGTFYSGIVGAGPGWEGNTYFFSHEFTDSERDFVRAELRSQNKAPHCLTNPIYFVGIHAPTGTEGIIKGVVRDKNGVLISDATVTTIPGDFSLDLTGGDGAYSIIVPNGTYRIKASKSGYLSTTSTEVVVASDTVTVDITLNPALCGTVPGNPYDGTGLLSAYGLLFVLPAGSIVVFRYRRRKQVS